MLGLRRTLPLALCVMGCTRLNPAFDTGSDGTGETADEVGDDPIDSSADELDSETGVDPNCEMETGESLTIVLTEPCGETDDTRYRRDFLVTEETGTGWLGYVCASVDFACTDCPDGTPSEIEVGPMDVAGLAGPGACLRIEAAQRDPALDSCSFDAIGVWNGPTPVLIASNGSALIGEALDDAGQIQPMPFLAEDPTCECVEECCVPALGPGDLAFSVEGQTISVGSVDSLISHPYDFHALKGVNPTGCTVDLEQAWALTFAP